MIALVAVALHAAAAVVVVVVVVVVVYVDVADDIAAVVVEID